MSDRGHHVARQHRVLRGRAAVLLRLLARLVDDDDPDERGADDTAHHRDDDDAGRCRLVVEHAHGVAAIAGAIQRDHLGQFVLHCYTGVTLWPFSEITWDSSRYIVTLVLHYGRSARSPGTVHVTLLHWCYTMAVQRDHLGQFVLHCYTGVTLWPFSEITWDSSRYIVTLVLHYGRSARSSGTVRVTLLHWCYTMAVQRDHLAQFTLHCYTGVTLCWN